MKRRNFIKGTLAAVALCGAGVVADGYRRKGNVKASDRHGWRHKAYLDGRDVSTDCQEADDVQGYVVLVARKNGKIQLNEDRSAILREKKRGVVRIECMKSPCPHCDGIAV